MNAPQTLFDGASKAARHRDLVARLEAAGRPVSVTPTSCREAKADELRRELLRFLAAHGLGAEVQAVDYLAWLDRRGVVTEGFDLRATGGWFLALRNRGVLEQTGYRANGGAGRHHSAVRPVYRIASLEFARLGWGPYTQAGTRKAAP